MFLVTNAEILRDELWWEAATSSPKSKLDEQEVRLVALHVDFWGGGCFKARAGGDALLRDQIKQAAERDSDPLSERNELLLVVNGPNGRSQKGRHSTGSGRSGCRSKRTRVVAFGGGAALTSETEVLL